MNLLKELLDLVTPAKKEVTETAKPLKGGILSEAKSLNTIDFGKLVINPKVPNDLSAIISAWKDDADVKDVTYIKKGGRKDFMYSLNNLPNLHRSEKISTAIQNVDQLIFSVDWNDNEPRTQVPALKRHLKNGGYTLVDFNHKGIIIKKMKVEKEPEEKEEKKEEPKKKESKK